MDVKGGAIVVRDITVWIKGDNIFQLTGKLRILKHEYARKVMAGVLRLNIQQ